MRASVTAECAAIGRLGSAMRHPLGRAEWATGTNVLLLDSVHGASGKLWQIDAGPRCSLGA